MVLQYKATLECLRTHTANIVSLGDVYFLMLS